MTQKTESDAEPPTALTYSARVERLSRFMVEGRIVRGVWTGQDAQGREVACLLAALSPEAGQERESSACPATVMPEWFARMVPWVDDQGSQEAWPTAISRFACIMRRADKLTAAQWDKLEFAVKVIAVREAMRHTKNEKVLAACRIALAYLENPGRTEAQRLAAVGSAACAVTCAVTCAAYAAAYAAANAAANAAAYVASTADAAAYAAASTAAHTADAAAEAVYAAYTAAYAAAVDRITGQMFDVFEQELGKCQ